MAAHGILAVRRRIAHAVRPIGAAVERNPKIALVLFMVGVIGLVGTAVDYSNAAMAKADLQNALDAAAQSAVGDLDARTDEEVKRRVQSMIQTRLLDAGDIANVQVAIDRAGRRVRCRATARVEHTVTSLLGADYTEIVASSDAVAPKRGDGVH